MSEAVEDKVGYGGNGEKTRYGSGLTFDRYFTTLGKNPLDEVEYVKKDVYIPVRKESDEEPFVMNGVEVPSTWSQTATDILSSKYFRKKGVPGTEHEVSARQVVDRVASGIRMYGEEKGYFNSREDANTFQEELSYLLINQRAAFNSPVWFNVGLKEAYGIEGGKSGNWAWDGSQGKVVEVPDAYSRPQASACFIQSVEDDLMNMMDLQKSEVKLFKYGSGTGTNFSEIRSKGESLSGGGKSSGLMSFLNGPNAWAGATKSGGTTRRAAKMVILNHDHPEIKDFVTWKSRGEEMVKILVANGYDADYESEAYAFAPGQNSNNSVRVTDKFMEGIHDDEAYFETTNRTDGKVRERIKNKDLWDLIGQSAWRSADPGFQFHDTINRWNPCSNTGEIRGSNPCSEYMFLDDTACNLLSINVKSFLKDDGNFDIEGYKKAIDLTITAQEILVGYASYPTKEIAQNSEDFRPLGIGYANLGALAMVKGMPYDSEEARTLAGSLAAILTGESYAQSARIAATQIGPFNRFEENREPFLEVMKKHRAASRDLKVVEGLETLVIESRKVWDEAVELGEKYGFRNAQASVIAPTGTISFYMDCDTTSIEPDYALKKIKKLAGGGIMTIINQSVPMALENLGYEKNQIEDVKKYIVGAGKEGFRELPQIKKEHVEMLEKIIDEREDLSKTLRELGYSKNERKKIRAFIEGRNSIEGAPHVGEEHYAIFDTANKSEFGKRYISPLGHVRMMAAAQPFMSGAISKTVNLPEEATVEEVKSIYEESWKLGVKAIALYRDNSKMSQPLNVSGDNDEGELEKELKWGERKHIPNRREGLTEKFKVGGVGVTLRTGEYEDGSFGEFFIDAFQVASEFRTALNLLARVGSKAVQYGMPHQELIEDFHSVKSDVQGGVDGLRGIKMASSIYDVIGRLIGMEYDGRLDFANNPDEVDESKLRSNELERKKKALAILQTLEDGEVFGEEVNLGELYNSNVNSGKKSQGKNRKKGKGGINYGPPCKRCGGMTISAGSCHTCITCGSADGCG